MAKTTMTFEEGIAQLHEMVAKLESGSLPIQDTFALYEESHKLLARLEKMLDDGEKRIQKLEANGSLTDITGNIAEAKE